MKIKINGKEQTIDKEQATVAELLKAEKVERPETVSVQLNGAFVKKEDYEKTSVKDSDAVDFLYFMGGGSER